MITAVSLSPNSYRWGTRMSVAFISNIPVNKTTWTRIEPNATCRELTMRIRSKDPFYLSNLDVDNSAYFTTEGIIKLTLPTALSERKLCQLWCKSTANADILEIIYTG